MVILDGRLFVSILSAYVAVAYKFRVRTYLKPWEKIRLPC